MMERQEMLARVPLFSEIDRKDLENVARLMVSRIYRPGDLVLHEGDEAVGFFVVTSGRLEVVKGLNSESPHLLATLGPGEFFGETALLDNYRRTASVRAVEETECLVMPRWEFLSQLQQQPAMAMQLLRVMARRLRETDERLLE